MPPSPSVYRFGPYQLYPRARALHNRGTKLKLRPQPFQVLLLLVERRGDVVTREELREMLWSSHTFVDFEQGLNTAIRELRSALNDSASDPRYIQTLPKVGYRLIVPVEVEEVATPQEAIGRSESTDAETPTGEPARTGRMARTTAASPWRYAVGISALLLLGLVGYLRWTHSRVHPQAASGRIMLAVLPFENLTGDPGQEYFSDGLTEEMTAQLGRIDPQHLGVIGRASVMHYKHNHEATEAIGRYLGVQYVLEGSVRRDAGKVRISAQLIQVKDQANVWSHQYDRDLSNLLALQDEIARGIAGEIRITLRDPTNGGSPQQASLSPDSYDAYDLYLRGLYFWNKRTSEGFERAVEYFQKAVVKDPDYARAYAGLANSYALMSGYAGVPPKDLMQKAREAAKRAVALDENLAESHTAMAIVSQNFDWDWKTAEREYRRAIELDPNYATAHHWYAEYLALMGRFDEAFVEIERARQLDPLSLIIGSDTAIIFYYSRQYDRSIEQFHTVLDMDPYFPKAFAVSGPYVEKGMFTEALASLETWRTLVKDGPWYWGEAAYYNGRSGRSEVAHAALVELRALHKRRQIDPLVFVIASIGVNDRGEALTWLQKAYDQHSPALNALKVDPTYDQLRDEPRFRAVLQQMGFPE
jgi:TolB-like protein/DNA-binding winged helix-turn-helix (wHTH) protein